MGGYVKINNGCVEEIANCTKQTAAQVCAACQPGYSLDTTTTPDACNACSTPATPGENCLKCEDGDGGKAKCAICEHGYVKINNGCVAEISNCAKQTSANDCSKCHI